MCCFCVRKVFLDSCILASQDAPGASGSNGGCLIGVFSNENDDAGATIAHWVIHHYKFDLGCGSRDVCSDLSDVKGFLRKALYFVDFNVGSRGSVVVVYDYVCGGIVLGLLQQQKTAAHVKLVCSRPVVASTGM